MSFKPNTSSTCLNRVSMRFEALFNSLRIAPLFYFVLFLIYSFLFRMPHLPHSLLSITTVLFVFLFIFQLFWIGLHFKEVIATPHLWLLVLFYASNMISFWLFEHEQNSFMLSEMSNHFVLFFVLYTSQQNLNQKKTIQLFTFFLKLLFIWNISMILISMVMLFLNYSGVIYTGYDYHLIGINGTRLYGIYADPNYAAVMAVTTLFIGIYFLRTTTHRALSYLLTFSIGVAYLFIVFTYSRTGILALAFAASIVFLYRLKNTSNQNHWQFLQRWPAFQYILPLFLGSLILVAAQPIRTTYNYFYPTRIERNAFVAHEDISNNRFDIWQSGLQVFQEHPVVGIGYKMIKPYMNQHYPTSYIAQNDKAYEFHNVFLDVAASQGLIGLLPFGLFVYFVLRDILNRLKTMEKIQQKELFFAAIGIIVGISVSALFISNILYLFTPSTVIFWIVLGTVMKTIPSKSTNSDKIE